MHVYVMYAALTRHYTRHLLRDIDDSDVVLFRIHWSMYANIIISIRVSLTKLSQSTVLPRRVVGCTVYMITRSSATAEIARVGGHYAVQVHSRSLILVPIES